MKMFRVSLMAGGTRHYEAECFEIDNRGFLYFLPRRFEGLDNPIAVVPCGSYIDVSVAHENHHPAHENDVYYSHEHRENPFAISDHPHSVLPDDPQPHEPHVDHRDAGGRFMKEP